MTLFRLGTFTSSTGHTLPWKIECDALTADDWACLAAIYAVLPFPPFGQVHGVPRGGFLFALALKKYVTEGAPGILIADDVLTTGGAMRRSLGWLTPADRAEARGVVAFDRSGQPLPPNVFALFSLNTSGM